MRFLFGIIVGAAISWGAAYLHDTGTIQAGPAKPFVNWDVVFSLMPR